MGSIQRFSAEVAEYAGRLSDMADAAEGKRQRKGISRWLLLPASGAALYALLKSDSVSRPAKEIAGEAKTRAADLPNELMGRVREATGLEAAENGGQRRSSGRSRKTSSRRKSRSSS